MLMERKLPRHTMTSSCTSCVSGSNRLLILAVVAFVGFVACLTFIVYLIVASTVTSPDDVSNVHKDNVTTHAPWLNTTMKQHAPALDSNISSLTSQRRLMFVGVLSVQPYFKSRLSAISSTWGHDLDSGEGQLVFYTDSREQETEGDLKEQIQTIEGGQSVNLKKVVIHFI